MKVFKGSLSKLFLIGFTWFEILYHFCALLMVLALKFFKRTAIQKEILWVQSNLRDLEFHLQGLGLSWFEIDEITVDRMIRGVNWLIFCLGVTWLLVNLIMSVYLFHGVQRGDARRLKYWLIFGITGLIMDICLYPLELALCGQPINMISPVCEPSGGRMWLHIIVKSIFYASMYVAWVHRNELLDFNERIKFEKESQLNVEKKTNLINVSVSEAKRSIQQQNDDGVDDKNTNNFPSQRNPTCSVLDNP